tara:strand:+ start:465 stop:629 length:165 start_codon:yes stop_codon:yes gene_type:complete
MNKKELIQTLEDLHAELQGATSVDEDAQALLATLTQDINRIMEAGAVSGGGSSP